MKRILLLTLMAVMTLTASAQFWCSASFNAGLTRVEEDNPQLSFGIAPQVGIEKQANEKGRKVLMR